mmetsp:Transcript_38451/g.88744  ORF Transcript_38451/g.88744 Transcript_38451/m.88744 type:complete len:88 (-) Transcript_38451:659-922(-)
MAQAQKLEKRQKRHANDISRTEVQNHELYQYHEMRYGGTNAQSGMPSLFSCATHAATRSSLISASLSWSKGKPKNLPSRTLLDSSNS